MDPYIQRVYIKREAKYLDHNSKIAVRDLLIMTNEDVKESPDGLRCVMDDISDESIDRIYTYMKNIIDLK